MPALPRPDDLLRKRLDLFTRVLHGVGRGDVRALHRTRVASRRLRELLPVLRVESAMSRKVGQRLRKVTERLGAVRELDVLALLIDELRDSDQYPRRALGRVKSAVEEQRSEARSRLADKLPVAELRRIAKKLGEIGRRLERANEAAGRRTDRLRSWRWAVEARVVKRAARASAAVSEAGAVYLPGRLHEVRIAVKKLRYAAELAVEMAGTKTSAELRILKRMQDVLGRLHDLQVLIERTRQVQASLTPPDLTTWGELEALVDSLEDECRRLHARYMRDRPRLSAACERLGVSTRAVASSGASRLAVG